MSVLQKRWSTSTYNKKITGTNRKLSLDYINQVN